MTLKDLEIGKTAVVTVVGGEGALRQHFLDMGVIPGVSVTVTRRYLALHAATHGALPRPYYRLT